MVLAASSDSKTTMLNPEPSPRVPVASYESRGLRYPWHYLLAQMARGGLSVVDRDRDDDSVHGNLLRRWLTSEGDSIPETGHGECEAGYGK